MILALTFYFYFYADGLSSRFLKTICAPSSAAILPVASSTSTAARPVNLPFLHCMPPTTSPSPQPPKWKWPELTIFCSMSKRMAKVQGAAGSGTLAQSDPKAKEIQDQPYQQGQQDDDEDIVPNPNPDLASIAKQKRPSKENGIPAEHRRRRHSSKPQLPTSPTSKPTVKNGSLENHHHTPSSSFDATVDLRPKSPSLS